MQRAEELQCMVIFGPEYAVAAVFICKTNTARQRGISMKRRILLVDDEVAVLLTMKAVLEITGFDVDTAASAREGRSRLRTHEYHMVITDMRMENDQAGREVIQAARTAPYRPAVALLTAFPVDEADWQGFGADQLLLKPMHTRVLLDQIEKLFESHGKKLAALGASMTATPTPAAKPKKPAVKKVAAKKTVAKKTVAKKAAAKKTVAKAKKAVKR
jgi:DNA-binding response OmpR family regulator